jgi:hypothetical protein
MRKKRWREKQTITLEPLEHMVQDWHDEVKTYCAKSNEVKEKCNFVFGKK